MSRITHWSMDRSKELSRKDNMVAERLCYGTSAFGSRSAILTKTTNGAISHSTFMENALRDGGISSACEEKIPSVRTGFLSKAKINTPTGRANPHLTAISAVYTVVGRWKVSPKPPERHGAAVARELNHRPKVLML